MEQTKERLQKVMAAAGVASRRECEKIILAGRVQVNGKPVTELGTRVGKADRITVDGKALHRKSARHTYLLYKPGGVVTTMKDPQGRRTVADLMAGLHQRLYPVGRLDYLTEGLLLMTNDGDFANRMMHPSHNVTKTYHTWVQGRDIGPAMERLHRPMELDGYMTHPAEVELVEIIPGGAVLAISIHEGRNRQVRKMCEAVGLKVIRLRRVSEAGLTLGELKSGQWRYLTEEELQRLRG